MKTVLGFFDEKSQADRARTELESEGIKATDINVFSNSSESTMESDKSYKNESFTDRVKYFFTHLGDWDMSDEHRKFYAEGIRRGGYVVSVATDDTNAELAAGILDRCGAVDIDRRGQFYRESGYQDYDMNAVPFTADQTRDYRNQYQKWEKGKFAQNGEQVIPVIEENVNIGKRAVEKGRVRILTKVSERPIEEKVKLRDEHVSVERRAADRAINTKDMEAFKEGEIELRETSEEPVIDKEARVVEEVVVSKRTDERTETVRDKVRKTDVTVDESGLNKASKRLQEDQIRPDVKSGDLSRDKNI